MRKMDEYLVKMDTLYPDGYSRETLFRTSGDMLAPAPAPSRRAGNILVRAIWAIVLWQQRRNSRAALLELNDDLLRDIGITRCQADAEARKSSHALRPSSYWR